MSETARVLASPRIPREHTNPYVTELFASLADRDIDVRPFTWRHALLGRYELVHLQWPEYLIRSPSPLGRIASRILFLHWMAKLALARIPVIETMHNDGAHEAGPRLEAVLLRMLRKRVAARIYLNADEAMGPEDFLIPHGHYRRWFADVPRSARVAGRIAYAGIIRPYKGVEDLLRAFGELDGDDYSLTISGRAIDARHAYAIRDLAASDHRVALELEFVPDGQLVERITSAELIVLPYRHVYNSGVLLLALSLDRPVLMRDCPLARATAAEAGHGWVATFEEELTGEDIRKAIDYTRETSKPPDLSGRDWSRVAAAHEAAFAALLGRIRGTSPLLRDAVSTEGAA